MGRLDGTALVAANGLLQKIGKGARLDHVFPACLHFALEELPQELHGKVFLGYAPDLRQELIRKDRYVRLLQTRRRENVHDPLGGNRTRDDLADSIV